MRDRLNVKIPMVLVWGKQMPVHTLEWIIQTSTWILCVKFGDKGCQFRQKNDTKPTAKQQLCWFAWNGRGRTYRHFSITAFFQIHPHGPVCRKANFTVSQDTEGTRFVLDLLSSHKTVKELLFSQEQAQRGTWAQGYSFQHKIWVRTAPNAKPGWDG